MKVMIPVVDNLSAKNNLAAGFHNAEYACIYDSESEAYEWIATDDISTKPGNLSIELKRKGIYNIISKQMSLMALGLFAESGLNVFKAESEDVSENIQKFVQNKLQPLTVQSAMGSSCSSSSCGSCSSSCN